MNTHGLCFLGTSHWRSDVGLSLIVTKLQLGNKNIWSLQKHTCECPKSMENSDSYNFPRRQRSTGLKQMTRQNYS